MTDFATFDEIEWSAVERPPDHATVAVTAIATSTVTLADLPVFNSIATLEPIPEGVAS